MSSIVIFEKINKDKINYYLNENISINALISYKNRYLICERTQSFYFQYIIKLIKKYLNNLEENKSVINNLILYLYKNELDVIIKFLKQAANKEYLLFLKYYLSSNSESSFFNLIKRIKFKEFDNQSFSQYLLLSYYIYHYFPDVENHELRINKLYIFPGGHIKSLNEGILNTLEREILEETNIKLSELKYQITDYYFIKLIDKNINQIFKNLLCKISLEECNLKKIKDEFIPNIEIKGINWIKNNKNLSEETIIKNIFLNNDF